MEGGAISLELTFRESSPEPGTAAPLSGNRSPKPRTGWYSRGSSKRAGGVGSAGSGRGSSAAAGWASTDADKQPLRWRSFGSEEVPALETCTLLPWLGGGDGGGEEEEAVAGGAAGTGGARLGSVGAGASTLVEGRWTEIGVYPPGDRRRRREALLLGYRSARVSPSPSKNVGGVEGGDSEGYVVALLVRVAPEGGLTVAEVCRAPLGQGEHPVAFNREKTPPGAPTNGRATAEAVCADGWVRRWCVSCPFPSSHESRDKGMSRGKDTSEGKLGSKQTTFALSRVDICQPFRGTADDNGGGGGQGGGAREGASAEPSHPPAALIAVASPTLLAVARSAGSNPSTPEASPGASGQPPMVEVWSCSKTPYPRSAFKKEGTVSLPGLLRGGQKVEGMCWVSPEAADERGAAVCGHGLCVSIAGSVTVLARERRQPVSPFTSFPGVAGRPAQGGNAAAGGGGGEVNAGSEGDWTWSPVFRVANPSSLLTCRTAGLRDFCQVSGYAPAPPPPACYRRLCDYPLTYLVRSRSPAAVFCLQHQEILFGLPHPSFSPS